MSVTLRKKENRDGSTSLYLDIYHSGRRAKEYLKDCKLSKASNAADRELNRANMALAKKIHAQRSQELAASDYNVLTDHKGKTDLIQYFEAYIARYTKKDKRNVQGACNAFKAFMKEQGIGALSMKLLTEDLVGRFAEYLQDHCEGEGAASYFARFKKVIKQAVREKIMLINPAMDVTIKRDESIKKEVLSFEEIKTLAAAPISNEAVKRAFLFSCFTGLRWVDVAEMKWKHIDIENRVLSMVQAKTGIRVKVELHNTAIALLPEPGEPDELVYALPSHTGAAKLLKGWVARAGITKHITWHCARHSFATNLITTKADVVTVSKLLGHNSLKYTQRYTHIADELKRAAVDRLPELF